jgi:hypothetical protein
MVFTAEHAADDHRLRVGISHVEELPVPGIGDAKHIESLAPIHAHLVVLHRADDVVVYAREPRPLFIVELSVDVQASWGPLDRKHGARPHGHRNKVTLAGVGDGVLAVDDLELVDEARVTHVATVRRRGLYARPKRPGLSNAGSRMHGVEMFECQDPDDDRDKGRREHPGVVAKMREHEAHDANDGDTKRDWRTNRPFRAEVREEIDGKK